MVIQCSSCDTRFKLADDKIKEGGVKVRCSKCKEVFTVMPPDDEATTDDSLDFSGEESASADSSSDWSDLNSDDSDEEAPGVDWSNMGNSDDSDDSDETSAEDSFSSDNIAFDDDSSDDNSFGFAIDDSSSDPADEDLGFGEDVGEGANDEFSFDDGSSSADKSADGTPDFDWDGSSAEESAESDDFDFGAAAESGDGGLDFSSVALEEKDEPPVSEPSRLIVEDPDKPLSAKGPQKSSGKRTGRKKSKPKKKGPLRGLLTFILLLLMLAGIHAGILYWKGYWKGDPAELVQLDHNTVHLQVYKNLYSELTGAKVDKPPTGQIAVLKMNGRFLENSASGPLFIIEGQVKNEFKETRSAIAVRGILYDQHGKSTMRKKIYCGNKLNDEELQTLSIEKIQERLDNQFGDSLSNLDVSPGVVLPYMIVFNKLPDNLAEFNVEVAESAPGTK